VKRLLVGDEGMELVEWGLVAGLVVAVGALVLNAIGGDTDTALRQVDALQ
jgi:hypothetical protein